MLHSWRYRASLGPLVSRWFYHELQMPNPDQQHLIFFSMEGIDLALVWPSLVMFRFSPLGIKLFILCNYISKPWNFILIGHGLSQLRHHLSAKVNSAVILLNSVRTVKNYEEFWSLPECFVFGDGHNQVQQVVEDFGWKWYVLGAS